MTTDDQWQQLADFVSAYRGEELLPDGLVPICRGASGRLIARFHHEGASLIAIGWTNERPDNGHFIPIAQFLARSGVRVPAILDEFNQADGGMAIVQDLGDTSLLSLSELPWQELRPFYADALEQVDLLHRMQCPADLPLQPPFDKAMYRWEQEYFAEHFLAGYLGHDPQPFLAHPAAASLVETLSALPTVPLHRDFQSQNIHIVDGKAWLIDFQGMRYGLPEYDVASLVYDPYARLTADAQNDLLLEWERITGRPVNRERLIMCAQQRLMQALGAYGKLTKAGNTWYEPHIRPALKSLCDISSTSWLAEPLSPVVECGILLE